MDETSNTPEYDKFRRRCLDAVEGMKFFDQPVQDMTAAELLVVVGHLVAENVRLQKTGYDFQSKLFNGITDAFLDRRWIPVTDRVPDIGVSVLCASDEPPGEDRVWIGQREQYEWYFPGANEMGTPTHWMPLPAPPTDSK